MGNSDSQPSATQSQASENEVKSPGSRSEKFDVILSPARSPAPARILAQRNTPTHSPKTLGEIKQKLDAAEHRRLEAERSRSSKAGAEVEEAEKRGKEVNAAKAAARLAEQTKEEEKIANAEANRAKHMQVVDHTEAVEARVSEKMEELKKKIVTEQEEAEQRLHAQAEKEKAKAEQREMHAAAVREKAAAAKENPQTYE